MVTEMALIKKKSINPPPPTTQGHRILLKEAEDKRYQIPIKNSNCKKMEYLD